MKLSAALLALAAATLPVFAIPTAEPEPVSGAEFVKREAADELEKRSTGIYVCEGTNWSGRCTNYQPQWNVCTPWSALGLSGLGSWGPDSGVYCIWYNKPCGSSDTTGSDTFTNPGFSTVPGYWMYNTQSWKCWW